ncbi:MAG: NUDIX domain-containing protein [Lachnospiraceae bacterium]|nr:NUDIX domain-containing protein [Lachnospiraceae bacterium]
MKLLKILDSGGYTEDMPLIYKQTVRAVILRNGKMVMQRSRGGEYKIPGGGLEKGEDIAAALYREVLEEAGMKIDIKSMKEIGEIIELRCDVFEPEKKFERHTYYYLCEITEEGLPLTLTESEQEQGFACVWETPEIIYECNKTICTSPNTIRDTVFIKMLTDKEVCLSNFVDKAYI